MHLFRAAKAGYKKAYGEIGIILYREKNKTDKAADIWSFKITTTLIFFIAVTYIPTDVTFPLLFPCLADGRIFLPCFQDPASMREYLISFLLKIWPPKTGIHINKVDNKGS